MCGQERFPSEEFTAMCKQTKEALQIQHLKQINSPLISWYLSHARDLPWRKNPSPYQVWISEIMLQQTRVEAVKPYYQRFLNAFPDISSLAQAKEETLFKLWEGLGYYSRAKNLKAAAIKVQNEYQGSLPCSFKELLTLPGIGSYTAGAIASIAFHCPEPAVDGNVMRVISRVLASTEDIASLKAKKRIETCLKASMDRENPGIFNQALFETGALICLPKGSPKCRECPIYPFCEAGKKELWREIPVKSAKKPRKTEKKTVLVICKDRQVAIRKRPNQGLLASLYEFPNIEGWISMEDSFQAARAVGVAEEQIVSVEPLGETNHVFSHVEWKMIGYQIFLSGELPKTYIWAEREEMEKKYPLPHAFLAYRKALSKVY